MKNLKLLILLMISPALVSGIAAQTKTVGKNVKTKTVEKVSVKKSKMFEEYKILAEGSSASVEEPFVFVARDAETYRQLETITENLPAWSDIDFSKTAIVAAFAGMKNTGGYAVKIGKSGDRSLVTLVSPPPDAFVTEAITYPFQIVLVPLETEKPLMLEIGENWTKARQTYRLSTGEFEYAGGFAGKRKKFPVAGTIDLWRAGDLVTLDFNLSGKGAESARKLGEISSGAIVDGKIVLTRLDAGSFSEKPNPAVKASGNITGDKLSLVFEPLPTNIADGYEARGKIEAIKEN